MILSVTELKANLEAYLDLVEKEDILIIRNGEIIAQLTLPQTDKLTVLNNLVGCAKANKVVSDDDAKRERLSRQ